MLKLLHFLLDRGLQWNRSTNDLLSIEGSRHFPRVLFQLQSLMSLINNHEYGIVLFVTSWKPRVKTVFKKRQEIKGRTFRSSVFYLNIWELPTVILFLNLQEIDIWKSYVTSASSSENQMSKQRQSGWFFLNLNIFECVSVT